MRASRHILAVVLGVLVLVLEFVGFAGAAAASGSTTTLGTPSIQVATGTAYLGAITCSSANCTAAGNMSNADDTVAYTATVPVSVDTGEPGTPIPGAQGNYTAGIACPTADCIAVTKQGNVITGGGSGTPQHVGIPYSELLGIACTTTTSCWAVGFDNNGGLLVHVVDGVVASVQNALGTSLNAIACPTATRCVAVGSGGSNSGLVVRVDDSATPGYSAIRETSYGLTAVACATVTTCYALTPAGTYSTNMLTITDADLVGNQASYGTSVSALGQPTGLACASATTCVAVGRMPDYSAAALVPIDNGVAADTATPVGDRNLWLNAISCPTSARCISAGYSDSPFGGRIVSVDLSAPTPPGPPASLSVSPASASIASGASQDYTATATDGGGTSLGDVTSHTTFTIAPDGSCSGATCTATTAGPHTVTGTDGAATSTASLTVTPGPAASLVVTPATTSIAAGASQTYAVTGTDSAGNDLGDVTSASTFTITPDGSCTGATCTATTAGPHTVTVTDGTASTTAALTVTPIATGPAATTTRLHFTPTHVLTGQPMTLTAQVSPVSGTAVPTGSVVFTRRLTRTSGGQTNPEVLLGTVPLDGTGTAGLSGVVLPVQQLATTYEISAHYTGSDDFGPSSISDDAMVSPAATTTTLTSSSNPSPPDPLTTLTATVAPVAPGAGTPTGRIDFYHAGATSPFAHGTLSGGQLTIQLGPLSTGAHAYTAQYTGDTNEFARSTSAAYSQTVSGASALPDTKTTLVVSPSTVVTGQPVAMTATVAPASGSATPTGSVTFGIVHSGTTIYRTLATVPLDSGGKAATSTTLAPEKGANGQAVTGYTIMASYSGSPAFDPSGTTRSLGVHPAATTTTLGTPSVPASKNSPIPVTATVTRKAPAVGTPAGTVEFFLDTATKAFATAPVSSGSASATLSPQKVGAHTLRARFVPSSVVDGPSSATYTQPVVDASTLPDSRTSLTADSWALVTGQPTALTASVSGVDGVVPTGTVTFVSRPAGVTNQGPPVLLGVVPVGSDGRAVLPGVSWRGPGRTGTQYSVTAYYNGSSDHDPSSSTTKTAEVRPASTTTTVSGAAGPWPRGVPLAFTATVAPVAPAAGAAAGKVAFYLDSGTTAFATVPLTDGVAAVTLSPSLVHGSGPHTVTAKYLPSLGWTASTGAATQQYN